MNIVVINLAEERGRWQSVCCQFEAAGLDPERIDAVAGAGLSAEERAHLYSEELNRRQWHKPLQPGEIGCYASHLSAWRRLVESGEPRLAVFEDDIDVDSDLRATLAAIERLRTDWDMVKLVGRRREAPRARAPLLDGHDLIEYRRVPGLTSGYVISRGGAEKLLARRVPFGRPVDVDLRHWWECDLRILGVAPYPVHPAPSSGTSTIGGRRPRSTPAGVRLRQLLLQARCTIRTWRAGRSRDAAAQDRPERLPALLVDRPAR